MNKLTAVQKWAEVNKLRQMAFNLKKAAIRQKHPDWNDEEVNKAVKEIFLYAST